MTRQADLKLRVRARLAKTGESYATARMQLLAERARSGRGSTAPAHFGGLGELDANQLERVAAAAAAPLSAAAFDLARDAWAAFRSADPRGLAAIAGLHHPELRFLAEAFDRLSREYPSTRDGLSLTERRVLAAVDEGAETAGAAFTRAGTRETRPFLGDSFCFRLMTRVTEARTPLLQAKPAGIDASTKLRLTAAASECSTAATATFVSTGSTAGSAASTSPATRRAGAGTKAPKRSSRSDTCSADRLQAQ